MPLPEPPIIPDYELLRPIGRGSYGDVWLARSLTGIFRAVKIVSQDRFTDSLPFEREFKGLAEFASISLVESRQLALLHVGRQKSAGFFYYVMELADDVETGREIHPDRYRPNTLNEVRSRRGRLPTPECIVMAIELARGIAGLHARGLVHRDIKPSNVILVGGMPKLADIGLVISANQSQTFVGTEGFIPPEGPGTFSSDIFGLGKVLYELVTGLDRQDYPRLPPNFDTFADRKELLEFNEVLFRACDPAPTKRYAQVSELLDDLLLLQAGRSLRRLRLAERNLSRAIKIALLLAFVAGVGAFGAYMERRRAHEVERERDELVRKTFYSASLAKAQRALETDDLGRAQRALDELIPKNGETDLRGLEWNVLHREAEGDPGEDLRLKGPPFQRLRFFRDGKIAASLTADNVLTIWDVASRRELRHIEGVTRLGGFSSDGSWLLGNNRDGLLQRWQVGTGRADTAFAPVVSSERTIPLAAVGTNEVLYYAESTDVAKSPELSLCDFQSHKIIWTKDLANEPNGDRWVFYRDHATVVSEDGRYCALSLIKGSWHTAVWKLMVIDLENQAEVFSEILPHRIAALAFSHDANSLVCALGDTAEVEQLDLKSKTWRWRTILGRAQANAADFSADDRSLAVAGRDGVLRFVKATDGHRLAELRGQGGSIEDLVWSKREAAPLTADSSGDLRLWKDAGSRARRETEPSPDVWGDKQVVLLSSHGELIASSGDGRRVRIFDTNTLSLRNQLPDTLLPVAFTPGDRELLTIGADNRLQRWRMEATPTQVESDVLFENNTTVILAQASDDAAQLVAGDNHGNLVFWNAATRHRQAQVAAHRGDLRWAVMSGNGQRVVSYGQRDFRVIVWDAATGKKLAQWLESNPAATTGAISQDGELLAMVFSNGEIEVRSLSANQVVRRFNTGSPEARSVLFLPDRSRLLVGSQNGELHVFATQDWREIVTLLAVPHAGSSQGETTISGLDTDASGSTLVAGMNYGRIRLWR